MCQFIRHGISIPTNLVKYIVALDTGNAKFNSIRITSIEPSPHSMLCVMCLDLQGVTRCLSMKL